MEPKRLYRSRTDRMLGGVCAGLARYASMDSTMMRVLFVVGSIILGGFGGIIAYAVLWAVIPEEPGTVPPPPPAPPAP